MSHSAYRGDPSQEPDEYDEYAGGDLDFAAWLRAASRIVEDHADGLGILDLPDRMWRADFDSGATPVEAALEFLADEGIEPED